MYLVHEAGFSAAPLSANTVGKFAMAGGVSHDTPAVQAARVATQLASVPDGKKWIEFEGIGASILDPAWLNGPTVEQLHRGFERYGYHVKSEVRQIHDMLTALENEMGIDRTDLHIYTNCEKVLSAEYLDGKGASATTIIQTPAARSRFPTDLYNLGTGADWYLTNGVQDNDKIALFDNYATNIMLKTVRRILRGAGVGVRAYRVQSWAGLGAVGFPLKTYQNRGYHYITETMDGMCVNDQVFGADGVRYDDCTKNQKWNAVIDGINRAIAAHSIGKVFIPSVWPDAQSDIELETLFNAWYRIGVPTVICFWDVDPDSADITRMNGLMTAVGEPDVAVGVEPLALDLDTIRVGTWTITHTDFVAELP